MNQLDISLLEPTNRRMYDCEQIIKEIMSCSHNVTRKFCRSKK